MADDDKMKVAEVRDLLNQAIPLQFRSAAMFTWAAGAVTGHEFQAVGRQLEEYGRLELEDARRLIEKLVALGGHPVTKVAPFEPISFDKSGIRTLMDHEEEALEALHAVIPETGQEARSEALEHLMEHMLMRKQEQVDFLERVRRGF
ncbi:MAG TPA: ferritin-like domain-containing protein [Actinomycetota bacterium]|nr:ferritin-like domain-containing protein [Actinomycetota bacterium]